MDFEHSRPVLLHGFVEFSARICQVNVGKFAVTRHVLPLFPNSRMLPHILSTAGSFLRGLQAVGDEPVDRPLLNVERRRCDHAPVITIAEISRQQSIQTALNALPRGVSTARTKATTNKASTSPHRWLMYCEFARDWAAIMPP